jgi:cytidylate kinase
MIPFLLGVCMVATFAAFLWALLAWRDARRLADALRHSRQETAYWRLQAALAARDLPFPHDPATPEPPSRKRDPGIRGTGD